MIYKIANKYYVKISSMIFSEVEMVVENNEVVIKPLGNKIEITNNTKVEVVDVANEKAKILNNYNKQETKTTTHRPNKYNRRK